MNSNEKVIENIAMVLVVLTMLIGTICAIVSIIAIPYHVTKFTGKELSTGLEFSLIVLLWTAFVFSIRPWDIWVKLKYWYISILNFWFQDKDFSTFNMICRWMSIVLKSLFNIYLIILILSFGLVIFNLLKKL